MCYSFLKRSYLSGCKIKILLKNLISRDQNITQILDLVNLLSYSQRKGYIQNFAILKIPVVFFCTVLFLVLNDHDKFSLI